MSQAPTIVTGIHQALAHTPLKPMDIAFADKCIKSFCLEVFSERPNVASVSFKFNQDLAKVEFTHKTLDGNALIKDRVLDEYQDIINEFLMSCASDDEAARLFDGVIITRDGHISRKESLDVRLHE